jgi:hypothetical protein
MKKILFSCIVAFTINAHSQTEISSKYDHIGKFNNGIAVVELNGKRGLINSEGKELIKPEWDNLTGFGADGIGFARKNGLVGLIKNDGTLLVEPIYERINDFKDGKAIVTKGFFKGMIDFNGKILIEPKYERLTFEENGLVRATVGGKEVLLKIEK